MQNSTSPEKVESASTSTNNASKYEVWKSRAFRFWLAVCIPASIVIGFFAIQEWQNYEGWHELIVTSLKAGGDPDDMGSFSRARADAKSSFVILNWIAAVVFLFPFLILGAYRIGAWIWNAKS